MKKWGILVLVILGGLLLALKYITDKSAKQELPSSVPAQEQPAGVALPPAPSYSAPQSADSSTGGGTGSYENIALPKETFADKGACQGGSLEEMRSTQGKYWGYFAQSAAFSPAETRKMYDFMGNYVGCIALAHDNISLCDSLPAEAEQNGIKVDFRMSLSYKCRKQASPMLFRAYMAGKTQNNAYCYAMLSTWQKARPFPVQDFCETARKGPEATRDFLIKAMPKKRDKIIPFTPTSESSCGGDAECVNSFRLYTAIKDGKVSECPRNAADRIPCEAMISRSEKPCEAIVQDMSQFYCSTMDKVKKTYGGYIGVSKEVLNAEIARKKLEKAEAERRKAAAEKTQNEINKSVRKILGKE